MAQISATLVKELRERTGSGMMECKKALQATDGDIEAAIEQLRKTGQAKAEKKAGRTAAEGLIVIRSSSDGRRVAMIEVNSETDFVAKDSNFQDFADAVASLVLERQPANLDELLALPMEGKTVDEARKDLIAKIGENVNVRRFTVVNTGSGVLNSYLHGTRIGVIVELDGGDPELAKDIAMHIAASRPMCISSNQVPADIIAKEREIYKAQAADSGKPAEIIEKMVEGKVRKYLQEVTLLGQPFVKDPDQSVEKLLKGAKANIVRFEHFELGEGIEKKTENFAEEVMAQARGN
jgi:elongation factor Ts